MERMGLVIVQCAVLALCLLRARVEAVRVESRDGGEGISAPCAGGRCRHTPPLHHHHQNTTPHTPHPRPQPGLISRRVRRQNVVVEVEEGAGGSHRVACTEEEAGQAACLRGRCFALDLGELRNSFCQCPAKYEGPRCELLSSYYFLNYYAQLKKGAIIGGVVVGILLLIIAISVYCSYRKGRRRKARKNNADSSKAAPAKPETAAMIPDGESQV